MIGGFFSSEVSEEDRQKTINAVAMIGYELGPNMEKVELFTPHIFVHLESSGLLGVDDSSLRRCQNISLVLLLGGRLELAVRGGTNDDFKVAIGPFGDAIEKLDL